MGILRLSKKSKKIHLATRLSACTWMPKTEYGLAPIWMDSVIIRIIVSINNLFLINFQGILSTTAYGVSLKITKEISI